MFFRPSKPVDLPTNSAADLPTNSAGDLQAGKSSTRPKSAEDAKLGGLYERAKYDPLKNERAFHGRSSYEPSQAEKPKRRARIFDAAEPPPPGEAPRYCAEAGCNQQGLYRAPKSRDQLRDYWWFCLDHVKAYNARWNYYAGMSVSEMEAAIREAIVGERPSWPIGAGAGVGGGATGERDAASHAEALKATEEALRARMRRAFMGEDGEEPAAPAAPAAKGELAALRVLGLWAPVPFAEIKAQYRSLMKAHHPDRHGGNKDAEERVKKINEAFTFLKSLYSRPAK